MKVEHAPLNLSPMLVTAAVTGAGLKPSIHVTGVTRFDINITMPPVIYVDDHSLAGVIMVK